MRIVLPGPTKSPRSAFPVQTTGNPAHGSGRRIYICMRMEWVSTLAWGYLAQRGDAFFAIHGNVKVAIFSKQIIRRPAPPICGNEIEKSNIIFTGKEGPWFRLFIGA